MKENTPGSRIMIVEDEVIIAKEIRMILEKLGYQITSVSDTGETAVTRAKTDHPDVILMDINLKGPMDGIDAAVSIRETQDIPVIFITAHADDKRISRAKLTMPNGYIIKPFRENDLKVTVEMALYVSEINREREKASKALQESEAKYRLTFDASPDAVNINRLADGLYVDINPGFTRLTGYTRDDVIGRTSSEIDIWHDPADRRKVVRELEAKGFCDNLEAQFRCKDGSLTTALMSARKILLQDEPHIISITRDISERKQAEIERERLLTAIAHSGEAIVVTDTGGTIEFVNQAFETITGYSREEVLGQNPRILKSGQQDEAFYRNLWTTISQGNTFHSQMVNKRKDDSLYTEDAVISPVFDESGRIVNYVAVKRDISQQKRLEEQLRQSQKMEALGTLAGGIAHDFNNILYPIVGHSEMLIDDLAGDKKRQGHARSIFNSALRAADLVKQILAFSRQSQQEKQPMRLQSIINDMLSLIRHSLPTSIRIAQVVADDCPPVMANANQIHQVLMNLITNANQAMSGTSGTLTLGLAEIRLGPDELSEPHLPPGDYVDLYVADTGAGMNEDVTSRIFDPFFTTREIGQGTGLGLSVSYGIVREHDGFIRVVSRPGQGSTFHVFLPVAAGPFAEKETAGPDDVIPTGSEHILLVDDEPRIVALLETMLKRLGYRVTAHTSGRAALDVFRKDPGRFDLVITDMTMPDMTGVQVTREIHRLQPGFPVILCTGFSEQINEEKAAALGLSAYVLKPVVRKELAAVIRKVLDKRVAS